MFRCRDIVGVPPPVTLNPFVRKYVASEGYVACSTSQAAPRRQQCEFCRFIFHKRDGEARVD
jgi:hypothetical protein